MPQKGTLSPEQVDTLARALVFMAEKILSYYDDPVNEEKYQRWFEETYGRPAPEWDRRGGYVRGKTN